MKPDFVDNRAGNTLDEALRAHLRWAQATYQRPLALAIATGYFNPEGFSLLADDLEPLREVRLLLGAEPQYPPVKRLHRPGEPRGARLEGQRIQGALREAEQGLRSDRDLIDFSPEADRSVRRLLSALASGKIEVRRYERGFLHGKAFVFSDQDGVLAGSSNFTAAGLRSNLELNLGHYEPRLVERVQRWFDELWALAVSFDLAAFYRERFEEYEPYLIYLRVLWERYGKELEAERDATGRIALTTFQTDGVARARRILEEFHGVVVADGVGLGKTFVAGEIIRLVRERRQRVLLIAPATLRDGTWAGFLHQHQLQVDCVSYEQLAADRQLGGDATHLRTPIAEYSLVVIDEAHAFRNPDTERAAALRTLLEGTPPKDLVLLTATPVNNSLWDLYHLLGHFVGHDAVFADRGIPSLKGRFEQAAAVAPDALRPELLFDVLDAVTVRRTRHFVRRYYPGDRIKGPGGIEIPVTFPTPVVRRVAYAFDQVLPGFFHAFEEAVMPVTGTPRLTMARYSPSQFRRAKKAGEESRELALTGLIRSGLLKRLESSVHAFANTLDRMITAHDHFLRALEAGYVPTAEGLEAAVDAGAVPDDDLLAEILRDTGAEPASEYDVERLRRAVKGDRDLLGDFWGRVERVDARHDPKLAALTESLEGIVRAAEADGRSPEEVRDNRKVLIFTYFAETVDWIVEHLERVVEAVPALQPYFGRVASVSGQDSRGGVSRDAAVFGFAPRSTEAPPGREEDRFDILVTTDVLAEGLNLQQCRNIVNFDLPWNPMRLVQRHGRIDRIGSLHARVYISCFFPDQRLDDLLDLEARIRRKLAQAAASIGVESEVIPGGATAEVVFSETREEIERIAQEDESLLVEGGERRGAHSGEEYRQELRRGIEHYGERRIAELPWGAGSGFAAGPETGHFFCARVGERSFLRFVASDGGDVVRDTLECLRRIHCTVDTPRVLPPPALEGAYAAWAQARKDVLAEWTFATDPKNLQPRIRPVFQRAAAHLRSHPPEDAVQTDIDRAISALLAPRSHRIERRIREVVDDETLDLRARARAILERVRDLGLAPFEPPKPLPAIQEEDITLICWLAVVSA